MSSLRRQGRRRPSDASAPADPSVRARRRTADASAPAEGGRWHAPGGSPRSRSARRHASTSYGSAWNAAVRVRGVEDHDPCARVRGPRLAHRARVQHEPLIRRQLARCRSRPAGASRGARRPPSGGACVQGRGCRRRGDPGQLGEAGARLPARPRRNRCGSPSDPWDTAISPSCARSGRRVEQRARLVARARRASSAGWPGRAGCSARRPAARARSGRGCRPRSRREAEHAAHALVRKRAVADEVARAEVPRPPPGPPGTRAPPRARGGCRARRR